MNFKQIRYALAVDRERNFSRAAEKLYVSQPALSEQIKQLEDWLGFELFRRTGRGVETTEKGRAFFYEAQRVANDFLSLMEAARRLKGNGMEPLNIGIGSGLAPMIFPRMFANGSPPANVQLEVRTAPTRVVLDQLHSGNLHLGISMEVDPERIPRGISIKPLMKIPLVVIAQPGHPLSRTGKAVDLGVMIREPVIMSELAVGYGKIVTDMFNDLGMRPKTRAVSDNIETTKVMVRSGMGLALVPAGSADNEVALGLLVELPTIQARQIDIHAYVPREGLSRQKDEQISRLLKPFDAASATAGSQTL